MAIRRSVCVRFALGVAVLAGLLCWAVSDKSADDVESADEDDFDIEFADDATEDDGQKQSLDSFCGIEFGTKLKGELERVEGGKYLSAVVELGTPFRGTSTATVYAGVKSKRVFRVEVGDFELAPNLTEILEKRYGVKGEGGSSWEHPYCLRLKNGFVQIERREVGTGTFTTDEEKEYDASYDVVWLKTKERENKRIVIYLCATNNKYQRIADAEYVEESGGDGSSVL